MNAYYRSIWSPAASAFVAVSEITTAKGAPRVVRLRRTSPWRRDCDVLQIETVGSRRNGISYRSLASGVGAARSRQQHRSDRELRLRHGAHCWKGASGTHRRAGGGWQRRVFHGNGL